jgi:hypothetical protein
MFKENLIGRTQIIQFRFALCKRLTPTPAASIAQRHIPALLTFVVPVVGDLFKTAGSFAMQHIPERLLHRPNLIVIQTIEITGIHTAIPLHHKIAITMSAHPTFLRRIPHRHLCKVGKHPHIHPISADKILIPQVKKLTQKPTI